MGIKFKNDAVSVLTGSLTTVSTDILIDAADDGKFPVIAAIGADYFYLTLEDKDHNIEIVKIVRHVSGSNNLETDGTADSGVNRGLDGTTARNWAVGDVVEIRPNAKALEDAIAEGAQATVDHISDPADAHDASAISYAGGATGMSATDVEAAIDELANERKQVGNETIWIPAVSMMPTVTAGCSNLQNVEVTSSTPNIHALDFDQTTQEYAQFEVAFPKSWNKGTVTYQVFWTSGSTGGSVVWSLQGVAIADDGALNQAYGTAVNVTDAMGSAANDMMVSAESGAVTIGNTPANDKPCFFRFSRVAGDGSDNHAADARLIGVKLLFTTDAVNDA